MNVTNSDWEVGVIWGRVKVDESTEEPQRLGILVPKEAESGQ